MGLIEDLYNLRDTLNDQPIPIPIVFIPSWFLKQAIAHEHGIAKYLGDGTWRVCGEHCITDTAWQEQYEKENTNSG